MIFPPLSIWVQLGSFSFILAGVHGDLLVIRFFLFFGYVLLFLNACLGSPLWPSVSNAGLGVGLDGLLWSCLGAFVHGASLFSLIWDEREVELEDREAALWRMLYRTGGLSARLYKTIVSPYVQVVEFQRDEAIPTDDYFYIVYRGLVHLRVFDAKNETVKVEKRIISSGEMFDIRHVGMFQPDSFFETNRIECHSITNGTLLFRFQRSDMAKIAQHRFAKDVWQALLINNLTYVVENYANEREFNRRRGEKAGVDKIFEPLKDWELPGKLTPGSGSVWTSPLWHLLSSMYKSFSPPWPFGTHPSGIRQTLLPPPGPRPATDLEGHRSSILSRQRFSFFTSFHGQRSRPQESSSQSNPTLDEVDDELGTNISTMQNQ